MPASGHHEAFSHPGLGLGLEHAPSSSPACPIVDFARDPGGSQRHLSSARTQVPKCGVARPVGQTAGHHDPGCGQSLDPHRAEGRSWRVGVQLHRGRFDDDRSAESGAKAAAQAHREHPAHSGHAAKRVGLPERATRHRASARLPLKSPRRAAQRLGLHPAGL